ncbi:MAG: VanZ family protein [Roseburia sp.]|nr:VanZ family protein [Roseburia sp.]
MFRLVGIAMDVLPAAVILLPVIVTFQITLWKPVSWHRNIWMIIFALYLAAVFSVVGIPNIKYIRIEPQFNLIPVVDIVNGPLGYMKNTVLNILMFLPLGFLLPVIWKEFWSFKRTAVFGFALSLAIELSQIFTYRLTDVDDLITNTLGAILGYYVARVILKKTKTDTAVSGRCCELAVLLGSTLLVMFFAQPYISSWLWDMVI